MRYRPSELPGNGEIREALLALAACAEGRGRQRRLFAMRVLALEVMGQLEPFSPRLIGSVSTGHIRVGSDIDLHVFTDREEELFAALDARRERYTQERVSIFKGGALRDYLHVHLERVVPVELTVYPWRELRHRPRSSTDGKPIVRVKTAALEALLATEHADAWARYVADGVLPEVGDDDEDDEDGMRDGAPWDGLLTMDDEDDDPEQAPTEEELLGDGGEYDALPGFEGA